MDDDEEEDDDADSSLEKGGWLVEDVKVELLQEVLNLEVDFDVLFFYTNHSLLLLFSLK